MSKRASLFVSALVVALLAVRLPARAADTSAAVSSEQSPEHRAPKKAAPPPPAPRAAAAEDPYRCHPSEDISCTVVRETSQGTLIVTLRPKGQSAGTPAWMVINGAPPSAGPHPGGTVYVVPNTADTELLAHQTAYRSANGAPILD